MEKVERKASEKPKKIKFTVDGEKFSTTKKELTPNQILKIADVDPATHYLIQIVGKKQISYKDQMDEPLRMKNGMKFVTMFSGSTPVS